MLLTARHITKRFRTVLALDDVSFEVNEKSKCLLLGANGAGKTTLIKCILGLLRFQGQIEVDGLDSFAKGEKVRERIGYVPQAFTFYDKLSVEEEGNFVAKLKGASRASIRSNLELMDLWDKRESRIGSISYGMRQRLAIALALINDPPILIFDEPLSSIDLTGRLEFQSLVQRLADMGKTVLISTHLPGLSEFVDKAIILERGKLIVDGSPRDLLERLKSKDKLFIKLPSSRMAAAKELLTNLHYEVEMNENWITASVDSHSKAEMVSSLLGQGYEIQDMIAEAATIESEYIKFSNRT